MGVTCNAGEGGGLTVSVAVLVWVPWPVSELVKVMGIGPYVPAARLFAFTVNITVVPEGETLPDAGEAVSQFGRPDIE
jgi:hypothetical protein